MKTKITLITFGIIALALSVILPFCLKESNDTFNQTLGISSSLISAIFSVLTFIIAIILFQKFGIDNIFLQKRTDVVFQLLEKINSTNYFISGQTSFRLNLGSAERKNIEELYSQKLSFSVDYYNDLDALFAIANSPFMPKGIVEKMEPLRNPTISFDISENEKKNYSCIYLVGQYKQSQDFGRLNSKDMILYDLLIQYIEIKEAIVYWIDNNTSINTSDLNI